MTTATHRDVLVVGGGPAGATAGALLAAKGRAVLILEKEKFPRYHIGESLMPYCYFTFERLGVLEKIRAMAFVEKHSVQFVGRDGRVSTPFYFFQHFDHPAAKTWQVPRADFDRMLLDHAREAGATVREETEVTGLLRDAGGAVTGVLARASDGSTAEYRARVVIDATGRDALFLRKTGTRRRDPQLNKVAIWTYFRGAKRDAGLDEGATTVAYLEGKGWFWHIPLRDDIVSSGVVAERDYLFRDTQDPRAIFAREVRQNPWIEDHLSTGRQFGEYWVTGEYSYRGEHCAADGLVLVGDAFAFLDPVFSSGVFLALKTGELAADAVDAALARPGPVPAAAFAEYGERVCQAVETMRRIVYAFYDPKFSFADLIRAHQDQRGPLTDCLIGNIDRREYAPLFAAMKHFATLPSPLPYGRAPAAAR
ncbi:MAG: NAD(P)/FAD-dependent oxidoreductase [Verrucomicrobia bacterium]|nr:NAD(P)/FAD-dependent oxidoreductase [Verrucomicrobiota bacterium]